jgi:ATP-dependent Clp protease ATP-binding subunit ClpC
MQLLVGNQYRNQLRIQNFQRVTKLVMDELKNFFRPEFLNRIDEIVVLTI